MSVLSCPDCGNTWSSTDSATCTRTNYCPAAARANWAAASAEARVLTAALDADDGTGDDGVLWSRASRVDLKFSAAGAALRSVTEDQSAREPYLKARQRWIDRRSEVESKRRTEDAARAKLSWRRITIGNADITEHVAAMFDAIVGSADWGSGHLDSEEIEAILIVGQLAGFDVSNVTPDADSAPPDVLGEFPEASERPDEYNNRRSAIVAAWRRQIEAKARALAGGDE